MDRSCWNLGYWWMPDKEEEVVKEGEVVKEDVDEVGILDAAKEVVEEIIETNDIEIDEIDTGLNIIEIVDEEIEKAGITEAVQEIVESDDGSEREQKKIEAMVVEVESNSIEKEVETSDELEETINIVKINEELGEISDIIEETLDIVEVETINVPEVIEKIPFEVVSEEIGDVSSEELGDESSKELEDDSSEEIVDETSEEVEDERSKEVEENLVQNQESTSVGEGNSADSVETHDQINAEVIEENAAETDLIMEEDEKIMEASKVSDFEQSVIFEDADDLFAIEENVDTLTEGSGDGIEIKTTDGLGDDGTDNAVVFEGKSEESIPLLNSDGEISEFIEKSNTDTKDNHAEASGGEGEKIMFDDENLLTVASPPLSGAGEETEEEGVREQKEIVVEYHETEAEEGSGGEPATQIEFEEQLMADSTEPEEIVEGSGREVVPR